MRKQAVIPALGGPDCARCRARADGHGGRLMAGSVTIALWRDPGEPRTVVRVWGPEEPTRLVAAAASAASS